MPPALWTYVKALLYFKGITTALAIAEAFESTSHDRLTRMLNGDWSGQTLFDWSFRILFSILGGYLMLDDTLVEKPYSEYLLSCLLALFFSRKKGDVWGTCSDVGLD